VNVTRELAEVRLADTADMVMICSIVNHYIETTSVNFRTEPQTAQDWERDWRQQQDRYPWLVAVAGGEVAGIAYAGPWKPRAAYDWCTETTVYVSHQHLGEGIGTALYSPLLKVLEAQGYRSAVGVIALPNPASVSLHESFGYEHAGTIKGAGYKLGRWHDVGFWQRQIAPVDQPPRAIRPVAEVQGEYR
jgi:phosphinothricin acetyltransferase